MALVCTAGIWYAQTSASPKSNFVDWQKLHNPILQSDDLMLKDAAVVYRDGWFYLYSSTRLNDGDTRDWSREWRFYRSRDLATWEPFHPAGLDSRGHHPDSPDVTKVGDRYLMVFQSEDAKRDRRLFWSQSKNLYEWSPMHELAPTFRAAERLIDGALAFHNGFYYLGGKATQQFWVSRAKSLEGPWAEPIQATADGDWAENFQFIRIAGKWRMVATGRVPAGMRPRGTGSYTSGHEPWIYEISGTGDALQDWARWTSKQHLNVPFEDWNKLVHANSAYLCDWREQDGWFYLFYAGSNDDTTFAKRGHAKIGVARSKDLVNWHVAGSS